MCVKELSVLMAADGDGRPSQAGSEWKRVWKQNGRPVWVSRDPSNHVVSEKDPSSKSTLPQPKPRQVVTGGVTPDPPPTERETERERNTTECSHIDLPL